VAHTKGLKDVCVDVIPERLSRDAFDDVTCQRAAVVGVRGRFAGREDARGQMCYEIFLLKRSEYQKTRMRLIL
jgi:hypothetical protein